MEREDGDCKKKIISFVFNVGIGTAQKFPKMMKALEEDHYGVASTNYFITLKVRNPSTTSK